MDNNNIKKRITAIICFALVTLLVFAAIPYKQLELRAIDTSKSNEEALKAKLSQYQSEQNELKKKLESTKSDIASKENEKQYLDSLVLATENELETANQLLTEYTNKIAEKQAEIQATKVEIEAKYQELLGRMQFIYEEENSENYLDMILNSGTVSEMLMTVERIGSMLDFDNSLMSELSAQLDSLQSEQQILSYTKAEQQILKDSLIEKEKDLEAQKAQVTSYISKLESDQAAYQAEYEKAKAAEKEANAQIEKLLEQRAAQQSGGGSPTFTGGSFIWPVPVSYKTISSGYGWRTLWGRSDFHLGIDIPVPYGTNVFASSPGTVVTATWHYSYGYYVLIDHGNGSATLYAHNSKLCVSSGDKVKQGDVIAKAGSTGSSSGNHVHFEVRIGGKTQNPLNYVSKP